jgi:hypothetical protein
MLRDDTRRLKHPVCSFVSMVTSQAPARITLLVLGLPMKCWRCEEPTTAIVGLVPNSSDLWLFTRAGSHEVLEFIAVNLPELPSGVGELKVRPSKTTKCSYLSNGCHRCDALLGNFFVFHEELLEFLNTQGATNLEAVASISVPSSRWQVIRQL